jgi:glyceraldehyde 3-phosphate dehydrogenase
MNSVGINGFGRIGKIVFLQLIEKNANIAAINIPDFDIQNLETYLKHDSTHKYDKSWDFKLLEDNKFMINNKIIQVLNCRDAKKLNWHLYGVNYVIDATGVYLTHEKAKEHNVDYLIMCAPAKDDTPSFMVNGNHEKYNGENIVNNVSCTSNALIPVLKVLNDNYKIIDANFITIHSTTSSQQTVDTVKYNNRTCRSIFNNIIPHTTGASKSIYKILPELEGKVHGTSVRVPVSNVSFIDLNISVEKSCVLEDILSTLNRHDFIEVNVGEFNISCDHNTTTCPSIIDKNACMEMQKNQFKLSIWYDNEWSYSHKVTQLLQHMIEYNMKNIDTIRREYCMENQDLKNKKVVLRLDWNVPIKNNKIEDYFRIKSTINTIKYILEQDPKCIMIVSHLGRPKGKDISFSFSNNINEINNYLELEANIRVKLLETGIDNKTLINLSTCDNKSIFLLDNIRFIDEETNKTTNFENVKDMYLSMGDIFINDAFACSHRDHMSITAPLSTPSKWGYGYLIEKEISCLSYLTNNINNEKVLAIMGGAKMDDKLPLLESLSKQIDGIYIAGGNINSILKEDKYNKYINEIKNNRADIQLMIDGLCSDNLDGDAIYSTSDELEDNHSFFDIGMQSIVQLTNLIDQYDVIFWNGTLGVVENDLYKHGSVSLVKLLIQKNKKVIIGGGDTACFVNSFDHNFHYVSTGGGASLEYLSYSKLVGLL